MTDTIRIPWTFITGLEEVPPLPEAAFEGLEALRRQWETYLQSLPDGEMAAIRRRSLRRLAIETGILERLYEVDWGLTLTLVAEGFHQEVVERAGGQIGPGVLETLRAQQDALEMVLDFVRHDRQLSVAFIRELHHAITRTQSTYPARDALGREVERTLHHGAWKVDPNHVELESGAVLEYTPPEHVTAEMDRLIALYLGIQTAGHHPIVQAAWLHHRFVRIHPFADGNGRVARALTLLVMQDHHYAPLVVDRLHRNDYLRALDSANSGTLAPLIELFLRLEESALASELERPMAAESRVAANVAETLAGQIAEARGRQRSQIAQALLERSTSVGARVTAWMQEKALELRTVFQGRGVQDLKATTYSELPPTSMNNRWFRRQIVQSARRAGHFADFEGYAGYVMLYLSIEGVILRYVASLHGAGRDSGVMAVTTFGILSFPELGKDIGSDPEIPTTNDAFRFVHSESIPGIEARYGELTQLLDHGLAVALAEFKRNV